MGKINLMYHDITSQTGSLSGFYEDDTIILYNTDCTLFEQQLVALQKEGVNENVIFTFDDGGVSLYELAAPLLERYGQKGVFFVPTAYIGTSGFMSEEQIKDLHKRGHIIGSHSHTHPSNIASLKYEQILSEWKISLDVLYGIIGEKIDVASIPNGYSSPNVIRAAQEAGISTLYTSEPTDCIKIKNNIAMLGRYVILCNSTADSALKIVENKGHRYLLHSKWKVLEIIKSILGPSYEVIKQKIFHRS